MRKIVKYHIFSHFHRDGLENVVNSYLKDGWQPCGGVSTRYDRKRNICYGNYPFSSCKKPFLAYLENASFSNANHLGILPRISDSRWYNVGGGGLWEKVTDTWCFFGDKGGKIPSSLYKKISGICLRTLLLGLLPQLLFIHGTGEKNL